MSEKRSALFISVFRTQFFLSFVKHDLKESVEVFMNRNLDPPPPKDVTHRVNDGTPSPTDVTNPLNYPSQTLPTDTMIPSQTSPKRWMIPHRRYRQPKYHLTEVTDTLKDSLFKNLIYTRNDELPAANYSDKPWTIHSKNLYKCGMT